MPGPSKIFPTLFIGNLQDAENVDRLYDLGITHVLSVGAGVSEKDEDLVYLSLPVLDMEDQNIMKHFENAYKFIEKGRNAGACLVHCNAGESRSATICTAYLMKKLKISVEDALEMVTDAHPASRPNAGFKTQLQQYYLNLHPELKKKTAIVEKSVQVEKPASSSATEASDPVQQPLQSALQNIDISPTESIASTATSSSQTTEDTGQSTISKTEVPVEMETVTSQICFYSCKICRKPLFTMNNLMPHQVSIHSIAYRKRDKGNAKGADQIVCSSYFLQEPLEWMGSVDENEGKLSCNKCQSRVGSWKWDGSQCSCGTWVTPSIQVSKNRVDERLMTTQETRPKKPQQPIE